MLKNQRYYLDFTADIERAIHCIIHNNVVTAKLFLKHAHKIDKEFRLSILNSKLFPQKLQIAWKEINTRSIPKNKKESFRFADKLLTISTILSNRTIHYAFH